MKISRLFIMGVFAVGAMMIGTATFRSESVAFAAQGPCAYPGGTSTAQHIGPQTPVDPGTKLVSPILVTVPPGLWWGNLQMRRFVADGMVQYQGVNDPDIVVLIMDNGDGTYGAIEKDYHFNPPVEKYYSLTFAP